VTYGSGGFGERSTFSICKMSFAGSLQKSRGLSPGTGNVSSAGNIGDWSDVRRIERPVTVTGARRRARTVAETEMSFMVVKAFGLFLTNHYRRLSTLAEMAVTVDASDMVALMITVIGYLWRVPGVC
jgi:hypothetical protein